MDFLVTSEMVNLRESPKVGTPITSLPRGTRVSSLQDPISDWPAISVVIGGKTLEGFVSAAFLAPLLKEIGEFTPEQLEECISEDAIASIMTNLKADKRRAYLPFLQAAMLEFAIDNPPRRAAFLAQVAHESGEFRYMEELASGEAYEGRKSLGNTEPGDGRRFKGRGPIQVTGRSNYARFGQMLGLDIVACPELAATPQVGFRIAAAFWMANKLNEYADRPGNFKLITKIINGGYNGLEDRLKYHARAKDVLGVDLSFASPDEEPDVDPADPRLIPILPRGAEYEDTLFLNGRLGAPEGAR